jgi:Sec-independent protein translocase protein TatA
MQQEALETKLPTIITEYGAALKEFRAMVLNIANELNQSRVPSLEQIERAQAAKLRLENALTLLEMWTERPDLRATLAARKAIPAASFTSNQPL